MSTWKKIIVSGSQAHLSSVTASNGSIISGSLIMSGSITNVDYIDFIEATGSKVPAELPGRIYYDSEEDALTVYSNIADTQLYVGQETHYLVKNNSGTTINVGQLVMFSGSIGNSGRLTTQLCDQTKLPSSVYVMGVASNTMLNGEDGFVVSFGKIKGINATGTSVGETWNNGDILYIHPTIPGAFTKNEPPSGKWKLIVAAVVNNTANGTIFVRLTPANNIGELDNVTDISSVSGDLLVKSGSVWKNSKQLTGSYGLTGSLQATSITGSSFTGSFTGSLQYFLYNVDTNENTNHGISIGSQSYQNYNTGIGIGRNTYNNYNSGVAIGNGSYNNYDSGVGIGVNTYDNYMLGLGIGSYSYGNYSFGIGIGNRSYGNFNYGIGIGTETYSNSYSGIGIGRNAYGNSYEGIGIGRASYNNHSYGVGIGSFSSTNYAWGVGIGYYSYNNYYSGVGVGRDTTSNTKGAGTVAIGSYSKAERQNEFVTTATSNTTNKAQSIIQKFREKSLASSGGIYQELFTDASSGRLTVFESSVYQFRFQINAIETSTFVCKTWEVIGAIKRNASNTTSIVGTPVYTITSEELSSKNWDVLVDADDTNESLRLRVKHDALNNVIFSATIWATETRI